MVTDEVADKVTDMAVDNGGIDKRKVKIFKEVKIVKRVKIFKEVERSDGL